MHLRKKKTAPGHKRCHWVLSSGPERALQGEPGDPGLSDLSGATGPGPKIVHQTDNFKWHLYQIS